jgi:hypothetical protein
MRVEEKMERIPFLDIQLQIATENQHFRSRGVKALGDQVVKKVTAIVDIGIRRRFKMNMVHL